MVARLNLSCFNSRRVSARTTPLLAELYDYKQSVYQGRIRRVKRDSLEHGSARDLSDKMKAASPRGGLRQRLRFVSAIALPAFPVRAFPDIQYNAGSRAQLPGAWD